MRHQGKSMGSDFIDFLKPPLIQIRFSNDPLIFFKHNPIDKFFQGKIYTVRGLVRWCRGYTGTVTLTNILILLGLE